MLGNREFSAAVERGEYPAQVLVPLDPPFANANGEITNLLLERFSSAAVISSTPGALRANHFHKTDFHYAFVVSGTVEYFHRPVGSSAAPERCVFTPGQVFFSPPMVEHAMFFPHGGTILTLARNIRDTAHHEEDVVRVELVRVVTDDDGSKRAVPVGAE